MPAVESATATVPKPRRPVHTRTGRLDARVDAGALVAATGRLMRLVQARGPVGHVTDGLTVRVRDGVMTLSTSDGETHAGVELPATVTRAGEVTVARRVFGDVLAGFGSPAALHGRSLRIRHSHGDADEGAGRLVIGSSTARFALPLLDDAAAVAWPPAGEPAGEVPGDAFARLTHLVAGVSDNVPGVPALGGVRLRTRADHLVLDATDRFRFAHAVLPWSPPAAGSPSSDRPGGAVAVGLSGSSMSSHGKVSAARSSGAATGSSGDVFPVAVSSGAAMGPAGRAAPVTGSPDSTATPVGAQAPIVAAADTTSVGAQASAVGADTTSVGAQASAVAADTTSVRAQASAVAADTTSVGARPSAVAAADKPGGSPAAIDALIGGVALDRVARRVEPGATVGFEVSPDALTVHWPGTRARLALLALPFPDVQLARLLVVAPETTVEVDAADLVAAVERAASRRGAARDVRLETADGRLVVRGADPAAGESEETVPATVTGPASMHRFNCEFLRSALSAFGAGGRIRLVHQAGRKPTEITRAGDTDDARVLVLPMRLE